MECLICGSFFNEKRMLKDLFRTKKFHVCLNCLNKYTFEIEYNYFPLNKKILEVVSLFNKDRNINYDAFIFEFSEIYKKISELNQNKFVLFCNKLYLSEEILLDFSHYSTLLDKDIVVLTNVLLV